MFPIAVNRCDEEGTRAIASVGMIYNVERGKVGYEKGVNQQEQRGQCCREKIRIKEDKGITVAGRITRGFTKPSAVSTYTGINTIQ